MRAVASGITGATPIWNEIMTFVLRDKVNETFKVPGGVVGTEICGQTGGPKNASCSNRFEYFLAGTVPKEDTFKLSKVWVDASTGQIVDAGTPNAEEKEVVVLKDSYSDKDYCVTCPRPVQPSPSPAPGG